MHRVFLLSFLLLASCAGDPASQRIVPAAAPAPPLDSGFTLERPRFGLANTDLYLAAVSKVFADESTLVGGCFQILSLEAPAPEELIYDDCERSVTGGPSHLVHLVAEENIRNKLNSAGVAAALQVGVRRREVPLAFEDGQLLGEVGLKMVEQARSRSGLSGGIHEQQRDYYVRACEVGCLSALADNPGPDTPAARLVDIGKLLAKLVDAGEPDRPAMLAVMRTKTKALALEVKSSEKGDHPRGNIRLTW